MISDKIAFVILTWNSVDYLAACLKSVLALPANSMQIYIADNGSADGTTDLLESFRKNHPEKIFLTCLPNNEGTTKPRNLVLRSIPDDTKWICVLDSDTVVNAAAIEALIKALSDTPTAMLAAPRMWKPGNEEQLSCKHFPTFFVKLFKGLPVTRIQRIGAQRESYPFFPDPNTHGGPPISSDKAIYEVDYAISACWMLRKEVLNLVGYLDEKYFYAPEDVDYCAMIWEHKYKVIFVSGASIYHNTQRLSHKKLVSSTNRTHLNGLIYYFRKHKYIFNQKIR